MASIEANPHYIIYFDNVRVDEFVKSWTVNLNCNGNIGTADIEFVYLPELAYTAASVKDIENSESILRMLGVIDNMTNVKIFVKNVFSGKYQLIFDGNIKGKSSTRTPGGNSLTFRATDFTAWTNRTIAPIVIPYTQSTHPSDKFIWEAQGIDVSKVMDVAQRDIINFKGKRLEEIINTVVTQALAANKVYASNQGVAFWDGIWDRMDLMADIDADILNKNVLDYIISPNQGNVDTMYVLLNDIFAKLMFEFYQDRDGIIRIKPPFWNEPVLKSHIIDPSLILSQSENTDYDKFISRVVITGGLDENFQTAGDFATKLWTPTGAYLSDGTWETVKKSDKYIYGWNQDEGGGGGDGMGGSVSSSGANSSGRITKKGFRFIKGFEGFAPYGCHFSGESFRTVGYGSTEKYNKDYYNKHKPFPCTEKLASEIYADRINGEFASKIWKELEIAGVANKVKVHQLDAMSSVAYNRGVYGFLKDSTSPWHLIKKNPSDPGIKAKWEKYAITSSGNVLSGLVDRRKKESNLYVNGQYEMKPIIKYNASGKIDGTLTDNGGDGYIPSNLKDDGSSRDVNKAIMDNLKSLSNKENPTHDFDLKTKRKGYIYKRKSGEPIVGYGMSSPYKDLRGNGVWWSSVEQGIIGHIQHLSSFYRKSLVSENICIDPMFGENSRLAKTVRGLGVSWTNSSRYCDSIMFIINNMLSEDLKDTSIGAESRAQYLELVTPNRLQKIRDYFIKVTQGRKIKLPNGITREQILDLYFEHCAQELIYPEVAIAQLCEDTGYLTFKGSVLYQQNNFANIGVSKGIMTKASDWYWMSGTAKVASVEHNHDAVSAIEYTRISDANDEEITIPRTFSKTRSRKPKYVVIDAGHGGSDSGVVGGKEGDKYYLKEKDLGLWLQNRVIDMLKANGVMAYHSRTTDRDIGSGSTYKKRTEKILKDIADRGHKPEDYLLVSIHAAGGTSERGYSMLSHSTESGVNTKNLIEDIEKGIKKYMWWHWSASGCDKPHRSNKKSSLSTLSEKNFPCGSVLIEALAISNLEDRKLWLTNQHGFRDDYATSIASGIVSHMGKNMAGVTPEDVEDTNETRPDEDSTATGGGNGWNGSSFKEDLDWSDVDFSELLKPTHDEMRYGGTVRQIEQPLIKFSNAGSYYDMQGEHNADANEVLKSYAKFYMQMNNSMINTSSLTLVGSPWLRPGFNIWVDPAYTDKVYYITGITHNGSASGGVSTNLQLIHGRHRQDFVTDGDSRGFGALSKNDDNIFTKNEYFKSAKHFGPVLENAKAYTDEKSNLINIMNSCADKGIMKAERSPYAAYYASDYGDAFLKTPTILQYNDTGTQIFTDDEWKEITGRSEVVNTATVPQGDNAEAESRMTNPNSSNARTVVSDSFKPIKKGDSGEAVGRIQEWLNLLDGASISVDNIFSIQTENAIKMYQVRRHIDDTGVYNETTKDAMTLEAKAYNDRLLNSNSRTKTSREFVNNGLLRKGNRGAKVKEVQGYLNEFMDRNIFTGVSKLSVDGVFGEATEKAVRSYQKAKAINVDGIIGPITTGEINKDLRMDNSGDVVLPPPPSSGDNILTNTNPENSAPSDEKSKAKGRITDVLFTDQYTPEQIDKALDNVYKNKAPGVVKQRMHIIEKGIISARKTSEGMYLNNNYNK